MSDTNDTKPTTLVTKEQLDRAKLALVEARALYNAKLAQVGELNATLSKARAELAGMASELGSLKALVRAYAATYVSTLPAKQPKQPRRAKAKSPGSLTQEEFDAYNARLQAPVAPAPVDINEIAYNIDVDDAEPEGK